MKLIVGLGNPGREYQGTRHNIGFMVIDALAKRHGIHVKARRSKAQVGDGFIEGEKIALAKPQTFMNLSGQAVGGLVRRYRLNPSDIIVVLDDVDLPLGRIRIRAAGSAGGHKGLRSIIHSLGTPDFPRVRIGIGSPDRGMVDYVLSKFHKKERDVVKEVIGGAAEAVQTILAENIEQAMNRFNPSVGM